MRHKQYFVPENVNFLQIFSLFVDSQGNEIKVGDSIRYKNSKKIFSYVVVDNLVIKTVMSIGRIMVSKYIDGHEELGGKKVRIWNTEKALISYPVRV